MKTTDLISALTADLDAKPAPLRRSFVVDVGVGFALSALFFFTFLGVRATFFASLDNPRFLFKFVVTATMAITGLVLVWRLSRPVGEGGGAKIAVWLAPALLIAACAIELLVVPSTQWAARLIGHNAWHCLTLVPFMALAPLGGLLLALKHGAPSHPHLAGAAAAFAASGLSATLYAANCPDDSPLFVTTWYLLATAIVVTLGWFAGGRWLRW